MTSGEGQEGSEEQQVLYCSIKTVSPQSAGKEKTMLPDTYKEYIEKENKEYLQQIQDLKDKLSKLNTHSNKQAKTINSQLDKLHRRNMQIKDLKAQVTHLDTLLDKVETKYDITVLNR